MLPKPNKIINIKTPNNKVQINCYYDFIQIKHVKINKAIFTQMCKDGCVNYDTKYCCPGFSPNFNSYVKRYKQMLVVCFVLELNQLNYKEYHKLRVGNAIIKPRLEKLMRVLEVKYGSKFLSNGACRLCKPCQRKLNLPCKHPQKMRFSLESTGVDCNYLVQELFKFPLLWYKDKKAPLYTAVVCGLLLNNQLNVIHILEQHLNLLY